jgi:hypothetical protein
MAEFNALSHDILRKILCHVEHLVANFLGPGARMCEFSFYFCH